MKMQFGKSRFQFAAISHGIAAARATASIINSMRNLSVHGCCAVALMICICLFATTGTANAGLVYDNGSVNGTINAWVVNDFYTVSNSFSVSSTTSLSSAVVGLWVYGNGLPDKPTPVSVDWAIGTLPLSKNISSGTANLSNTFTGKTFGAYNIYESSFSISGSLAPGDYWFSLSNGVASDSGQLLWDITNGPSHAYHSLLGDLTNVMTAPGSSSSSFQLFDSSAAAVPEPDSIVLLCAGMACVCGFGWMKKRTTAVKTVST